MCKKKELQLLLFQRTLDFQIFFWKIDVHFSVSNSHFLCVEAILSTVGKSYFISDDKAKISSIGWIIVVFFQFPSYKIWSGGGVDLSDRAKIRNKYFKFFVVYIFKNSFMTVSISAFIIVLFSESNKHIYNYSLCRK